MSRDPHPSTAQRQSSQAYLAAEAYLPRWLTQALPSELVHSSLAIDKEAAVLMVDMADFSGLTQRLAKTGAEGVEELVQILNGWFEAVIQPILAEGGDIVAFGGDCCTALFEDKDIARRTQRVQRAIAALQTAASPPARVGVAVGHLSCGVIGNTQRYHVVTTGPAVRAAAAALVQAQAGATAGAACLEPELKTQRAGSPVDALTQVGARVPPAAQEVPNPQASLERMSHFFPVSLWESLLLPPNPGEHREITTLFLRHDLAKADAASFALAAPDLARAAQLIGEAGGYVQKIESADKGTCLLAFFGLLRAQPEGPAIALRAALALCARRHFAAGVATGPVFAGLVGVPARHEYTAIGTSVNRAARLLQAAEAGTLRCDAATKDANPEAQFETLDPLHAKGFDQTLQNFSPKRTKRQDLVRKEETNAFVGRRSLLAELSERISGAGQRPLTLAGEMGLGKSRLLRECGRFALALGLEARIVYLGGALGSSLAEQLAEGLGLEGKVALSLDTVAQGLGLRSARLVLLLDDLHLVDRTSLGLLEDWSAVLCAQGAVVLATTRDTQKVLGDRLDLQALDQLEAAELARAYRPDLGTSESISIAMRARGIPLFVEALSRQKSQAGEQDLATLEAVLRLRIDALGAHDQRVLGAASVCGPVVNSAMLETLEPALDTDRALLHLRAKELLRGVAPGRFRFTHELEQEAAYRGLNRAHRLELHRRALAFIESRGEGGAEARLFHLVALGDAAAIGRSARKACDDAAARGDTTHIFDLASTGLAHATDPVTRCILGSFLVQGKMFRLDRKGGIENAQALLPTTQQLGLEETEERLLYDIATMQSRLADYVSSDAAIEKGLILCGRRGGNRARFLMVRGWNAWGRGFYPQAQASLEQAAQDANQEGQRLRILSALASVLILLGKFEEAERSLLALEQSSRQARIGAAFDRCLLATHRAEARRLAEHLALLRSLLGNPGDPRFTPELATRAACLHEMQGRAAEARSLRRRAVQTLREVGMRYEAVGTELDAAVFELLGAQYAELITRLEAVIPEAEDIEAVDEVARGEVLLATAKRLYGRSGRDPLDVVAMNRRHAKRSRRWTLHVEVETLAALCATDQGQRYRELIEDCRGKQDRAAERYVRLCALRAAQQAHGFLNPWPALEALREELKGWGCPSWLPADLS